MLGVILALGAGVLMSIPGLLLWHKANGDLTTAGNVFVQFATALGFLLVPMAIAAWRGASRSARCSPGSACGPSSPRP